MAKITEVVKLKTGYANFVELKSAFEKSQENADRMAMYRPTKSLWSDSAGGYINPMIKNFIS